MDHSENGKISLFLTVYFGCVVSDPRRYDRRAQRRTRAFLFAEPRMKSSRWDTMTYTLLKNQNAAIFPTIVYSAWLQS